ncbi:ankyrin repeat-containing domain protein [Colletotrichum acutatum]|uniref:Ankyrin repeat-containing domain protein n=1 Tax=Glomerella acutata TaxID=27357 RepID=A0AAD8UER9_GLOAC|nr:ankyrin repeat-containing domain protein [Colletotrichum acutatum]KAK1722867.1 ankyrin repeat-containing domain protein [Colletotrichum acutatum]
MSRHHPQQQQQQRRGGQEALLLHPQRSQQDLTYTAALADPFGSLQTPPHEPTQDFGQAAVIFPASEMGVSGEAAPRTLQRNTVTDDLDASSYSAGIPHSLNTVEFIEPWTLDASMTLMTPNSRHEDMSDLSTEDILTLGFARPTQGSPLHIAATHGHINVAKTLILHGSDVNAADKAGLAPIHYATQNNQGPMVTMLAEHGADVDFLDPDGCTPLYRAAESGNKAMVERLLRHGAKLS